MNEYDGFDEPPTPGKYGLVGKRYQLPGADGKLRAYTRVSNFVKLGQDEYNLQRWNERAVAHGVGLNRGLQLRAAAARDVSDKDLNDVAYQAKQLAGTTTKRDRGSAWHKFFERVDLGERVNFAQLDPQIAALVRAYTEALALLGLLILPDAIEQTVINDVYDVAGTLDRVVYDTRVQRHRILDVKSGRVDRWTMASIEAQLKSYQAALRWWTGADTWAPAPYDTDPDIGLACVVDEEHMSVRIVDVDLRCGQRHLERAMIVRADRRITHHDVEPEAPLTIEQQIERAPTAGALTLVWSRNAPQWTPAHTAAAAARKQQLNDRETAA